MFGSSVEVLELLAQRERLDAALMHTVGVFVASREWSADGANTPTSWLMHHGQMTAVDAARLVRNARLVHSHERTAKLLDTGDITSAHVDVLARAARHREACFDEHEDTLLDAARTLPVHQFRTVARRWRLLADDVLTDHDATSAFQQRHLHCSVTFQGRVRLDGVLDPEGGARLLAALDALMEPAAGPAAQRRADALVRLATGEQPTTTVDAIIDAATLAGHLPDDLTRARSDLDRIGPVAPSTVQRLACNALVGRIVRRGSEILDVGRRSRLATTAQRRAVRLRDGGCVHPGCDAPPEWCDVHHLNAWSNDGGTDLDNLVLVCRRHHVACHEGRWTLQRRHDGTIEAIPP
jgi:hypothetical protein